MSLSTNCAQSSLWLFTGVIHTITHMIFLALPIQSSGSSSSSISTPPVRTPPSFKYIDDQVPVFYPASLLNVKALYNLSAEFIEQILCKILPSQPVPQGKVCSWTWIIYALRCSLFAREIWRLANVGLERCGSQHWRNVWVTEWRSKRRGVRSGRSGRSKSKLLRSSNISMWIEEGVFIGNGIRWEWIPKHMTRIWGQSLQYSSRGS